ncbi:proton-conducting transporter transmembrane domain-containing protein [Rubritepida flocculans]|uniref:proton-conducting transporter transmembrane domain-containing protein n=1 Tax=Rubritepida flocculans TaxID=182403 RepID=UPI0004181F51|nr:proton-conducting transporter membrane subunit [Rubritepida flocculans]
MSPAGALVLLHLLGAGLLAAWPARAALLNLLLCGAALVPAALLLSAPGGEGWLRADALNAPFVMLSAIVGFGTALFSLEDVRGEGFDGRRLRSYHAAFQGFLAANHVALLSDNLGILWVAIEAGTLASVVMVGVHRTPAAIEAAWKFFVLCGFGIALALFGIIVLALAGAPHLPGGEARLSAAALREVAARMDPALLNLAFVFLLVGFGTKAGLVPLHSWLPDAHAEGPTPIAAVLSGLLLNAAMLAILRGQGIVAANGEALSPGGFLLAMGLASLLLAGVTLWRRRDAKRLLGWSSIEHMGLAAIAFGLGGPAGNAAGLLHLWGHALLKSAAFFAIGRAARLKGDQRMDAIGGLARSHPPLGWGLVLAMAGLAGLPPFSLFVSEWWLAGAAARTAPWVLALLLPGLLVAGLALLHAMQRLCLGPPTPDAAPGPAGLSALLPLWTNLLLALLIALALPAPLAALLREGAGLLP